jgi:ATP-dependent helicase/DNAse subunit B
MDKNLQTPILAIIVTINPKIKDVMTFRILTAPPAQGKTHFCIQEIKRIQTTNPLASIRVVVPAYLQSSAFRQRVAVSGGGINIRVSTFRSLYIEILERAGQYIPIAPEALISHLIYKSITQIQLDGKLSHFERIFNLPGLNSLLKDRFAELKRNLVLPELFLEIAQNKPRRIKEIADIYDTYQRQLQKYQWADPEGISWLAVEALEKKRQLELDWQILLVDGFDSFTVPQRKILHHLSRRIPEIIVTIPGTKEMTRRVHGRFRQTLSELQKERIASIKILDVPPYDHLPADLNHLEKNLGNPATEKISATQNIYLIEARSPFEEVREALRWIKALIIRENILPHECAIMVPDPGTYHQPLKIIGNEFGLPIRFTFKESLAQTPPFYSLLNLLMLSANDYPRRLLLDTINSPYFDFSSFGFSHQDSIILDRISRSHQIVKGLDVWVETLSEIKKHLLDEITFPEDDEEEVYFETTQNLLVSEHSSRLVYSLSALASRLTPSEYPLTLSKWIEWLEDLLDDISYFQNINSLADQRSHAGIRQMLRHLALTEFVAGAQDLNYKSFIDLIVQIGQQYLIADFPFTNQPEIAAMRIIEGRGARFQAVAILGLAEGLFPEPQRADPYLSEEIRSALQMESAFDKEQIGIFYQAITRADRKLLLTRPYLAEEGELWEPSPYWKYVTSLMSSRPNRIDPDAPRPSADAASPVESLTWAARSKKIPQKVAVEFSAQVNFIKIARLLLHDRLSAERTEKREGNLQKISKDLAEHFNEDYVWSPSALESYSSCPYRFFSNRLLGLEPIPKPEPGYDLRQLGSMLHRILELAYQYAEDPTDPRSVIDSLVAIMDDEFNLAPEQYGFRPTPLWEIQKEELAQKLINTVKKFAEFSQGWDPVAFEIRFGFGSAPPLIITHNTEKIIIRGLIDRIDKDTRGQIRIIDYKTGASNQAKKDLIEGRRLQLPLYALASRDALKMGNPIEGFYWQIFQAKRGSLSLSTFSSDQYSGPEGAITIAKGHAIRIVRAVRQALFPPVTPEGGCPNYCPAIDWCWHYKPIRGYQ